MEMVSRRSACSVETVMLLLMTLMLLGILNIAHMSNLLVVPSFHASQRAVDDETRPVIDPEHPDGRAIRVGMAFPARGPPAYHRNGCVYLERHHLEDRFVNEDACFKREQVVQILEGLVLHAADVFHAHNISYFLESGTLLGAFRNRGVIPHDYDGDLAIDTAGYEYLRTHPLPFDDDTYEMDVWNSPHYENAGRDAKLSARLVHKASALYVDVFVFRDRVDEHTGRAMVGPAPSDCYLNCVHCPRTRDGKPQLLVPREWVYPLRECDFGGRMLKCPAQTARYLSHQYGGDFMTPA